MANNAELFDESESNPINVDEYIERLAWRSRAANENNFDPKMLYDEFVAHIQGAYKISVIIVASYYLRTARVGRQITKESFET